jgi:hypothetical protein
MANNVLIGTNTTWTTAGNWSTGAAPVNGDVVFLTNNSTLITEGLNNATVKLTTLNMVMDFTGRLGSNNASGNVYLQIAATTGNIGISPAGGAVVNGSSLFNWNAGTGSTTINVLTSSNSGSAQGQSPIKLLGSALTVNLLGGNISIASLPTENATVSALNVIASGQGVSPQAYLGPGCNLGTLTLTGGFVVSNSQQLVTSAVIAGSNVRLVHQGTGGFVNLTIDSGGVTYNGSGSVNSLSLTGSIDLSGGGGTVVFGSVTLYAGAVFYDPLGRASFSTTPTLVNCTRANVSLNLGLGRYL